MVSLIQHFEADFLWKVSLRILNSEIILKTFTHDNHYYIPINDTTFELSVFWLSDTESLINKLRFSNFVSLSFKTRLTYACICFCGNVT